MKFRRKPQPLTFRRILLETATAAAAATVLGIAHVVGKITDAV